jgi:putative ABC transport system permease protein
VIFRRAARDLRVLGLRAVLVVVAIAMAAGTGGGASLTFANVQSALNAFYSKYHLADVEISLKSLRPQAALLARAKQAGATRSSVRLIVPGSITTKKSEAAALLIGMPSHPALDQLEVLHGKGVAALKKHGAVIEADFAHVHHLSLGSSVKIEAAGFSAPVTVEGIGRTPDSLFASADPEYFVLQRGSLAYMYLPLKEVQDAAASLAGAGSGGVDELLVDLPTGHQAERERILTSGEPVDQVVPRREQFGYRATKLSLSELSSFTPVLTAVLSAVAVLLIAVTMMRLVQAQRRELGTMLALGQKRFSVILSAVLPAMILGVLGGLLAIPACVAVAKLMASQFSASYGFLTVPTTLTANAAGLAVGLALGTSALAVIFPAVALARLTPSQALRGDTPASHRLPAWARTATGAAGAAAAYGLRNVVRTPVRSTLTALSLGGAIGLGIALHIVASSVQGANDEWFAKQRWTQTAVLQEPMRKNAALQVGKEAHARRVEPIVSGSVEMADQSGRLGDVDVVGTPAAPQLESIGLPSNGVKPGTTFVSKQLATQFGLSSGQRVTLTGPQGPLTVVIAGTANTLAEEDCYLSLGTAQALLGQRNKITSLLVEGRRQTAGDLRSSLNVTKVVAKSSVKAGLDNIITQLTLLMNTVVAIGLAVGALFLISSLAMSVLERQAEFAILRALGWGMRDLATVVVAESIVLTLSGAIVASLLAPAIASPLMQRINSAWFHVSYNLRPTNFLAVVVPALVLAIAVALQTSSRLGRLDVGRAVRTRVAG